MSFAMVRGLRGATTCAANTPEEINEVTQELLLAMLERNGISHDDVISVLFTTTPDLDRGVPRDRRARCRLWRHTAALRQ